MAYNSSGTFSRLFDWTDDRDNGIKIRADRFDQELDGFATGLTTTLLKDGTQTATAIIPFAVGLSILDNQSAIFGTNSDYTLQYDEATRDALILASNVEGAAFKLTLAADQGDDASDEWQVGISTGGVLSIGNDIASAQTYVSQLTLTPNATVANSTTAVLGNLTVGGDLTVTGDDITMTTNTAGHVLVGDGTNYNPVAVSGDVTLASSGAITIASGSVETAMIAADAITSAKIADDAINSEHYTDGSIDTAHIADSQITVAKMAANSVDSDQYVNGSIDTAHIANLQITTGLIAADAITAAKIADDVVNSEHYAAGSIDTEHIADSQVTVAKMADNSIDSDQYVDGSIDTAHISDNAVTLAKMAGIARGKFIVGDASGNPAVIGPGTNGQVLTSDGTDIAFADAAGGGTAADDISAGDAAVNITTSSGNITIDAAANDTDIIFKGTDNSADITMLTLDGSDAGQAIFNSGASFSNPVTITTADNDPQLTLVSTDADANEGPVIDLKRNSSSPADDDNGPRIKFTGKNDAGEDVEYTRVRFNIQDMTDGTEDGQMDIATMINGSLQNRLYINDTSVVINDAGVDSDFRVESDTKSHAFFMEGSNGRIVINAADATSQSSHMTLLFESASYSAFAGRMTDNGSGAGFLVCRKSDGSTIGQVARNGTSDAVQFLTSSDYRLKENVSYNFDATAKLKQLKPCTFTWINDESNTTYQGFLAHEVQDIVPHAVNGAKDAVDADGNIEAQSIDKSDIVPLLVKTIQELEARITALESA